MKSLEVVDCRLLNRVTEGLADKKKSLKTKMVSRTNVAPNIKKGSQLNGTATRYVGKRISFKKMFTKPENIIIVRMGKICT